jgi:hypothetical protein
MRAQQGLPAVKASATTGRMSSFTSIANNSDRVAKLLAVVLAVDLGATSLLAVLTLRHPMPALASSTAAALAGVSFSVVAVAMANATLQRRAPSTRVLRAALATVAVGLIVNTAGALLVASTVRGALMLGCVVLVGGGALGLAYIALLRRALALSQESARS